MFHPTLSKSGRFFFWPLIKFTEFMGNHFPETLLRIRYRYVFKKKLNLNTPQDLNEKILWAKLYADSTCWTLLADKYRVREYIADLGLTDILVPLYAVWYKISDVNFDVLPETFIIKANNGDGKGTNKIIKKSELTEDRKNRVLKMIDGWLHRKSIGALHAEPHYKNMVPCVIAEELLPLDLDSSSLTDYKIWCFNGKAYYIWVCNNRCDGGNSAHVMTYDLDWEAHPEFSIFNSDYLEGEIIPKPQNFDRMIEVAEKLSTGFPELRVDLYNVNGKIYFGELTFTSNGCRMAYFSQKILNEMGDQITECCK